MEKSETVILGAGVTGLACGYSTGFPVFEMNPYSGGICSSYYCRPGDSTRFHSRRSDEEDYRFEYGGGHWIFGHNDRVERLLGELDTFRTYHRRSSVYLKQFDSHIPFPIQNNLRFLPGNLPEKIVSEISGNDPEPIVTMFDWCENIFGKTLSTMFFHPFHELYTAGLWKSIQPQDGYKSPVNKQQIIDGASRDVAASGYNVSFVYPEMGLNTIMSRLQQRCDVRFGKNAVKIDKEKKIVYFMDGTEQPYRTLISTLPLTVMQSLASISTTSEQDPYTSVLVLNIGARRGPKAMNDHWVYFPGSESGFHRVGFYSNVDERFLPASRRGGEYVSIYVERTYVGGEKPSKDKIRLFTESAVDELQKLGYICETDVIDPTWIDVAYTWSYPHSSWREEMIASLRKHDIVPVGRYATWKFQGILDSINDGLTIGSSTALR